MHPIEIEKRQIKNGFWPFFGCFMQQHPNAPLAINRLLNAEDFELIVEFGTHLGGLSMLFALYCFNSRLEEDQTNSDVGAKQIYKTHHRNPRQFYTFDNIVRDKAIYSAITSLGSNVCIIDILDDQKAVSAIGNLIKQNGQSLILCDNGNKIKELELYGGCLKSGDFILIHDYMKNEADFEAKKSNGQWFSWETDDSRILPLCEKFGIEQMYQDIFDDVMWFCGRKA